MVETIKSYVADDAGASASLLALEEFIGDMDGADLADDSTVDASDAVTGINGLIYALERRDAEIARLTAALEETEQQRDIAKRFNDDAMARVDELLRERDEARAALIEAREALKIVDHPMGRGNGLSIMRKGRAMRAVIADALNEQIAGKSDG